MNKQREGRRPRLSALDRGGKGRGRSFAVCVCVSADGWDIGHTRRDYVQFGTRTAEISFSKGGKKDIERGNKE